MKVNARQNTRACLKTNGNWFCCKGFKEYDGSPQSHINVKTDSQNVTIPAITGRFIDPSAPEALEKGDGK